MRNKIILGIVVLVIIVMGAAYYNKNGNVSVPAGPTKIGVIAGTTGQYAFVGVNFVKGLNMAVENWNKENPSKQVQVVIEDDSFDAKKGLSAYQKLVSVDKVDAIANMTSVTIDVIYADVVKRGIPLVQTGEQGIEPADDNIIQVMEGNMITEEALGAYAKDEGYKNIAVFVLNNATFERFLAGFKKGYSGTFTEYKINSGDQTIRTQVTKALAQKPDAVVMLMSPPEGATIVKTFKELSREKMSFIFDGSAFTGFPEYKRLLGDTNLLNGSAIVIISQKENPDFTKQYKEKYGEDPGIGASWGYDGLTLLIRTKANDDRDWVNNMKTASYEGAGGAVTFDSVGVRKPNFYIGLIENGELPK